MAVPNNTLFSLQDVVNEVAGSQSSLAECFAEASSSQFDSAYQGSKNSLLNFRNYGAEPPVIITYSTMLSRGSTAHNACIGSQTVYYLSGSSVFYQASGIYTNSSGTTKAIASFYSDGSSVRYWNGTVFSGSSAPCSGI